MADTFEAVIIGSGFGGTILALSFANMFEDENSMNNTDKKACILERGQWWISHELNYTPKSSRKTFLNMREYLEDNGKPYHFWAHPDNAEGILKLLSSNRTLSKTGLYDYKVLGNVHAIAASGVGGGSMIYSNVTLEPHKSIYIGWPTQKTGKPLDSPQDSYFDRARRFIGVNKIPTTAGLSSNLLDKSKALSEAGQALLDEGNTDILNTKIDKGKTVLDFAVDLSITDVPSGLISEELLERLNGEPPAPDINELSDLVKKLATPINQNSVCQRQGRCNLGCIPGSRHTLGKKFFDALNPKPDDENPNPKPKPLEIRELCDVYNIKFNEGAEYPYTVEYYQYDSNTEQRQPKEMLTKYLVIAAGSIGSTELLLKCQDRGSLKLSSLLGKKFYTNGDLLGYMALEKRMIDSTRGPINASHVAFKTPGKEFAYTIEDTTISKMVAPAFATLFELYAHDVNESKLDILKDLTQDINLLIRFGILSIFSEGITLPALTQLFTKMWNDDAVRNVLIDIMKTGAAKDEVTRNFVESVLTWAITDHMDPYAAPEERMSKFYVFSCMGAGETAGSIKLKPNWKNLETKDDPSEKIIIEWPAAANNQAFKDILNGMKKLAGKIENGGEERIYTPLWDFDNPEKSTTIVLHPLGGCSMGNNMGEGIVNSYGQVFWNDGSGDKNKVYPNLFVIDGAIVPGPLGVNSSLTIAAIAFRAAENIVKKTAYLP